jgi:hypothetical protein
MTAFVTSALLTTSIAVLTVNAVGAYTKYKGDVNSDNKLSQKDAVLAARKAAGWTVGSFDETAGDVNRSGEFDSTDAELIAQYVSGKEKLWPNTFTDQDVAKSLKANAPILGDDGWLYSNSTGGAAGNKTYSWEWSNGGYGVNTKLPSTYVKENNLYRYTVTDSEDNTATSSVYQLKDGTLKSVYSGYFDYNSTKLKVATSYADGKLTAAASGGAGQYGYCWVRQKSGSANVYYGGPGRNNLEAGAKYYCTAQDQDFGDFYTHHEVTSDTWCVRSNNLILKDVVKWNSNMHYAVSIDKKSGSSRVQVRNLAEAMGLSNDDAGTLYTILFSENGADHTLKYFLTLSETDSIVTKLDPTLFNIQIKDMDTGSQVIRPTVQPNGNANGASTVTLNTKAVGGSGSYTYQWYYGDLSYDRIKHWNSFCSDVGDLVDVQAYNGATSSSLTVSATENSRYYGKYFYCTIKDSNGITVNTTPTRILKSDNNYDFYNYIDTNTSPFNDSDNKFTVYFYLRANHDFENNVGKTKVNASDLSAECYVIDNGNQYHDCDSDPQDIGAPVIEFSNEYSSFMFHSMEHSSEYFWRVAFTVSNIGFYKKDGTEFVCELHNDETGLTQTISVSYEDLDKVIKRN